MEERRAFARAKNFGNRLWKIQTIPPKSKSLEILYTTHAGLPRQYFDGKLVSG